MAIRVAFTLIGGKRWTGGYNYLRNLLQVLTQEAPEALTPVLLAGQDIPPSELAPFVRIAGCEVVRHAAFDEAARSRLIARGLLSGHDKSVTALLAHLRVDLVFESAVFLGWRLPLPAIAWIPDLQHRFLPQLFSPLARWRRELGFRAQIASDRAIMCSSEDTRLACERIYPASRGHVHAVRFAVSASPVRSDTEAREVASRHSLPARYFFMPNQFWVHKNHRLVLEALKLLAREGRPVAVVASGAQLDPRHPQHAPALLADVKAAGLQNHFLTPGLLPYEDLAPLMQASQALLNPSLFEGWSTTVEEARAAGVPMVLSDLAVHREQAGDRAVYFDPHSPRVLADVLATFEAPQPAQRAAMRLAAAAESAERIRRFATDFVHLAQRAAARDRAQPATREAA